MPLIPVQQFHDELIGISSLGIPMDLGIQSPVKDMKGLLEEIAAKLPQSVQDDQSLLSNIANDLNVPAGYRKALAIWLATDGSPIALETLVEPAISKNKTRKLWNFALFQPLVLLTLSFIAMIYICSVTMPKLESMYEQLGQEPHMALRFMIAVRKAMVVWIPLVPIAISLAIVIRRKPASTSIPKHSTFERWHLNRRGDAIFSQQLAELLENNVALPMALELLQGNDRSVNDSADPKSPISPRTLRPMMEWAVSEKSKDRSVGLLQAVAARYRQLANAQDQISQQWIPPLAMAFLGGILVLGVATSVCWPMAELLFDLSKPGGGR